MILDVSGIPKSSLVGKVLRMPLRLVPRTTRVWILQGPLRGRRWIVGSGPHGYWLGSYERRKQDLLAGLLRPGQVFLDVGANVGFYSLLSSLLVGPKGRVFAFEPLPENLFFLRSHLEINGVTNVHVVAAAVGEAPGRSRFAPAGSSSMGRLDAQGALEVETVSLDALSQAGKLPRPDVIKMDIEGGEGAALAGARETLRTCRPTLLLATHGWVQHQKCRDLLRSLGYEIRALDGGDPDATDELVATPSTP